MDILKKLDKRTQRPFEQNWMTHDAMWFYYTTAESGIESANKINRLAVRAMAKIEAKRIGKLINMKSIEKFDDLVFAVTNGFEIIRPDFMKFKVDFPEKNLMRWQTESCFAHDGVKSIGMIDQYECGIMERVYGWLEAFSVKYSVNPDETACLMHKHGKCQRLITTELP